MHYFWRTAELALLEDEPHFFSTKKNDWKYIICLWTKQRHICFAFDVHSSSIRNGPRQYWTLVVAMCSGCRSLPLSGPVSTRQPTIGRIVQHTHSPKCIALLRWSLCFDEQRRQPSLVTQCHPIENKIERKKRHGNAHIAHKWPHRIIVIETNAYSQYEILKTTLILIGLYSCCLHLILHLCWLRNNIQPTITTTAEKKKKNEKKKTIDDLWLKNKNNWKSNGLYAQFIQILTTTQHNT